MEDSQYLETVLRPITTFLDEALANADSDQDLSRTAGPLIQAIETVPGSGRVAIFLNPSSGNLHFLGGPSFEEHEVASLASIVETSLTDGLRGGRRESIFKNENGDAQEVRLFPLHIPTKQPKAVLVTVRTSESDPAYGVFDGFMDQISQIAGIVVEDRHLRSRIAEQQSVLEAIVAAAPDAIIRINRQGTILDFLGGATKLFGWRINEIVGKTVVELMPEPHATRHDEYIAAFLKTGERKLPDFGRRLLAKHRSGETFPVEIALSQIPGSKNTEFIGIVRDISQRVERETELDTMREALDIAGRQSLLGEFAATIAHELNQPLTAIANYMDALELRLQDPSEENLRMAGDLAKKAASQARLGGEIIRRTRRMALNNENEMALGNFHEAVAEAVSILLKSPSASNDLVSVHQEGLPVPCLFDRVQIQQVVINLVSNSLRAIEGMPYQHISVFTRQSDEHLQLVVRDTGPGVPDSEKPKIFDRFFRRSNNGMGLGLSIVRRIAVAHGGDIKVADAQGGGAEFILTFPFRVV